MNRFILIATLFILISCKSNSGTGNSGAAKTSPRPVDTGSDPSQSTKKKVAPRKIYLSCQQIGPLIFTCTDFYAATNELYAQVDEAQFESECSDLTATRISSCPAAGRLKGCKTEFIPKPDQHNITISWFYQTEAFVGKEEDACPPGNQLFRHTFISP
jgi:hypothetical protein